MATSSSTAFATAPPLLRRPSTLARAHGPRMVAASRPRTRRTHLSVSPDPSGRVRVEIQAPSSNRRQISACNIINASLDTVWQLLSDYGNLSCHIPNLQQSTLCPHPNGGIRVSQCGAQSILGFQFRASLVMDMLEVDKNSDNVREIRFLLVSSNDFREFEGVWTMQRISDAKTALYYTVTIVPKGIIPVRAIEWRISEDVPDNMHAVRMECERRRRISIAAGRKQNASNTTNPHLQ